MKNAGLGDIKLIVVPDPDDPPAAELMVDGQVGDRQYRFLLDTGAGSSSVIYDDYTATFPLSGHSESGGLFSGKSEDLVTIPSLRVGPVAQTNLVVNRLPKEASSRSGLIGMDVIGDYRWLFRFQEGRAQLDVPFEWDLHEQHDLRMDRKGHPYVFVRLGDAQADAVWDTGAGVTVVDLDFVERNPRAFEEAGTSWGTDSTGTSRETPMFIMAGARVAGTELAPHLVAGVDLSGVNETIDMPMDMIVGYTTYSIADWYFDFPGRRWTLWMPPAGEP